MIGVAGGPGPDTAVGDDRWKVPPSLDMMLQPLEALHRTSGAMYAAQTAEPIDGQAPPAQRARMARTASTWEGRRSTSAFPST